MEHILVIFAINSVVGVIWSVRGEEANITDNY